MSRLFRTLGARLVSLVILAVFAAGSEQAIAQDAAGKDTELGPVFLLSLGGKLYDNYFAILDEKPPEGRNPALERKLSVQPSDTWRCVTCHGWDYTGAEISGTQFPALRQLAGGDEEVQAAVKRKLRDPAHPFPADRLSDLSVDLLAIFITQGQYARADFVSGTGVAVGNPEFGRDIFEGACISCHQLDGRMYLHRERGDRSSLGWVSRHRPEQALHKIMNGVPAAEMLSLRFLSDIQIADLLAYLQTLDPNEN